MGPVGRCRSCSARFALVDLLDDWSCRCPACGVSLAEDGPAKAAILRNAAAADRLHADLVHTLRAITSVPGNLEVEVAPMAESLLRHVNRDCRMPGRVTEVDVSSPVVVVA